MINISSIISERKGRDSSMVDFIHDLKNINTKFFKLDEKKFSENVISVGSIPLKSQMSLSSAYYNSAQALLDISVDPYSIYDIQATIHPIMFLFRHSIELAIKGILPTTLKHHKLDKLYQHLVNYLKEKYDLHLASDIFELITFISSFDNQSTLFRYADEILNKASGLQIDLTALSTTMRELNVYFVLLKANIEMGILLPRKNSS